MSLRSVHVTRTPLFLLLLLLAGCEGCGDEETVENNLDGGVSVQLITFTDESTGLELQLSEKWTPLMNPNTPESVVVDARYIVPIQGLPVRPRVVVSQVPLETERSAKLEDVIDSEIDVLKASLRRPNVKIKRISTRSLIIDGRSAGGFDLKYAVVEPKSERESLILQRTLMIFAQDPDEKQRKVEITATYVETGDREVADEVESMFNSIKFNR